MKRNKIIILNAPPGCGKDTIGNMIAYNKDIQAFKASFKEPMFEIAIGMLGVWKFSQFIDAYNDRKKKEEPQECLNGMTPRQFMIWISEEVMKPRFGKYVFGHRLLDSIERIPPECPIVVTDGGFKEETMPLLVAGHYVHVCRLFRDGYSFDGDSRDYLDVAGYHHRMFQNDFNLVEGKPEITVGEIIKRVINIKH